MDEVERREREHPLWQRVWDRVPAWARFGLGGLVLLLLAHIALGIRIWYGLQDPPEVAAIRAPGRHIIIPGANRDLRNPANWLDVMPAGLKGTSAEDVTAIRLDEQATDELVAYIAEHFPNVHSLYLSRGRITSGGLLVLKNCPKLAFLDVSDTDVDDALGELLPHLPKLTTLFAMNTNVGDGFARAAAEHPLLEYCPIEGTNVTPAAVAEWKAARPKTRIQTDFDRVALRGVIVWSDGETSRRFDGPYELGRYGPQLADGSGTWSRSSTMRSAGLCGSIEVVASGVPERGGRDLSDSIEARRRRRGAGGFRPERRHSVPRSTGVPHASTAGGAYSFRATVTSRYRWQFPADLLRIATLPSDATIDQQVLAGVTSAP